MQFLFPPLTIGFVLLAVPLLVHLINVLRQRRQDWAAMDFLLASYRKQRKWIWLRQMLLLLLRTAIVALLVAMLAGWVGRSAWLDAFGGQTTHHVVILDDSLSMADKSGGTEAYRRALTALEALTKRLGASEGSHQLTVLRTSRAQLVVDAGLSTGDAAADLIAQTVQGENRAIDRLLATRPSPLAGGIEAAIDLANSLIEATTADETSLYVLTDLRRVDWENPERISTSLQELSKTGARLQIVDCAASPGVNLGVTQLKPVDDVWVAGVPLMVEATVHNYSNQTAKNITLEPQLIRYPSQAGDPRTDQIYTGKSESLPAMVFDSIAPGKSATKQFQVFVAQVGTHAIQVSLPEDVLPDDNMRYCTLPLVDQQKVLIVDGDAQGVGAYFVASVLNPGGQVRTGAVPEVRPISFLNSASIDDLAAYRVIYLLDLPRIDDAVARLLDQYVSQGGGLTLFLGNDIDRDNYNRLTTKYPGLLPGQLQAIKDLPHLSNEAAADLVPDKLHPIAQPLSAVSDGVLGMVRVLRSWQLNTQDNQSLSVRTVISRRDGLPFVAEHSHGEGRVVTVFSDLNNQWTNWAGDPTFVVFLLRTNALLWSVANPETSIPVGQPLALELNDQTFTRNVDLLAATSTPPRLSLAFLADTDEKSKQMKVEVSPATAAVDGSADVSALLQPGLVEWWLTRIDGLRQIKPVATVVADGQGDLRRLPSAEVQRALRQVKVALMDATQLSGLNQTYSGGGHTGILLLMLALAMIGEQIMGYLGSYHPPQGARA